MGTGCLFQFTYCDTDPTRSDVTHWVQLLLKGGKYGPDYGHPMTADLFLLFHDVVSGSEMTSYVKIDKPLVVYRFWGTL